MRAGAAELCQFHFEKQAQQCREIAPPDTTQMAQSLDTQAPQRERTKPTQLPPAGGEHAVIGRFPDITGYMRDQGQDVPVVPAPVRSQSFPDPGSAFSE